MMETAILRLCDSGNMLEYRRKGHRMVVDELCTFLTLLLDEHGESIRGVRLYGFKILVRHARDVASSLGKHFSLEDISIESLVRIALIGVHERYLRDCRSDQEFLKVSRMVCRFVSGVLIPLSLFQGVCDV